MSYHVPVMLQECIDYLIEDKAGIYIDCTLGGGGHSEKILQTILSEGQLYSIDQDPDAWEVSTKRLGHFNNFNLCKANFSEIDSSTGLEENSVDGILMDLGVSSFQLDEATRGFSFQSSAKLDMRMDSSSEFSAYDVVNSYEQHDLVRIFFKYGEEKQSKKIAQNIINARNTKPIESTKEFADVVGSCLPEKFRTKSLARIFQAVRIEVNHELDVLETALEKSFKLLKNGGRLVVMSYHSLEDRIVKQFIAEKEKGADNFDLPVAIDIDIDKFKRITRKPIIASSEEIAQNVRARSAKLRVAEKQMKSDK